MDTRTIRRTSVALPFLEEPGRYLSRVASLEGGRGRVAKFCSADADLRELDLSDAHLVDGRITGLKARRTSLERLRVDSVEVVCRDLASFSVDRQQDFPCGLPGLQTHGRHGRGRRARQRPVRELQARLRHLHPRPGRRPRDLLHVLAARDHLRLFRSGRRADRRLRSTADRVRWRAAPRPGPSRQRPSPTAGPRVAPADRHRPAQTLQLAAALTTGLDVTFGEDLDDER